MNVRIAAGSAIAIALFTMNAGAQAAATPSSSKEPLDTGYVDYDSGPITLPLGVGFRIPAYNRVDGVALPWGPIISLGKGRVVIDPTLTYRSHLGAFDPRIKVTARIAERYDLTLVGGRATFTNDSWIRSDIINSAASLGVGSDARNYFRADRATVELARDVVSGAVTLRPSVGVLHENAWSTGSQAPHTSAPWSVFGRTDSLKMRRVNPAIAKGRATSALAAVNIKYELKDVTARLSTAAELMFDGPPGSGSDGGGFAQITMDGKSAFPTFGTQHFDFRGHAVFGFGDEDPPPQRFAYLGGAGTLATVDLLALGGDRLLYVEGEYSVPLTRPLLPFVGAPVITLRYAAGAAGLDSLPALIQNIGIGVGVKLIKAEYHVDPNYRKTPYSRRNATSIGFSLSF